MDKTKEKPNIEIFDYSTIPKFMQEHGRFCLWMLVQKPGKDKPDKIPYQVNGKRADATNPNHFSSFEDAVTTYTRGGYAGIGIGCFAPMKFCDVDDCILDGKLDARSQDIVNILDSYTELSPSGNGIHIFFTADKVNHDTSRYYINNRETHVEVYDHTATGRFLTLTGNAIHGSEVSARDAELQLVPDKHMKRSDADTAKSAVQAPGSYLSDESVYSKASSSKQSEKFSALWNGEIPEGKSHSEADMALAEILAF